MPVKVFSRIAWPANSLSNAAFMKGNADHSAINHAFKRWIGKSPAEYRME
jgi:hypothetical protein